MEIAFDFPNLTKSQNYVILKRKEMPELGLSPQTMNSRLRGQTKGGYFFTLLLFMVSESCINCSYDRCDATDNCNNNQDIF